MYLLVSALVYEAGKREAMERGKLVCSRVTKAVTTAVEAYDKRFPAENPPCDRTIMCLHEGRHKKGCHGYTIPFHKYARDLSRG